MTHRRAMSRRRFLGLAAGASLAPLFGDTLHGGGERAFALGAYDTHEDFAYSVLPNLEHTFVAWNHEYDWGEGDQERRLTQFLAYARARDRLPMITLEPWEATLADVPAGRYDADLFWVIRTLWNHNGPIIVRFMHEMDIGARYAWATQGSRDYIAAYNYVCRRLRATIPGVRLMWSPAGNEGLQDYYPDPQYVDYVGLSCYSYPAWEVNQPWSSGTHRTFRQNFGERYARVEGYEKPIVIAELGATGANRYEWLGDAFRTMPMFPRLRGAVLYSAMETGDYGPGFPPPNWRVDPETLESVLPWWARVAAFRAPL